VTRGGGRGKNCKMFDLRKGSVQTKCFEMRGGNFKDEPCVKGNRFQGGKGSNQEQFPKRVKVSA